MKLKPFNLERALAGEPVVTRAGKKVIEIKRFDSLKEKNIVFLIEGNSGVSQVSSEGKIFHGIVNDWDLFMAPIKKIGYIALCRNVKANSTYSVGPYSTQEEADNYKNISNNYITTIQIEWEE